VPAKWKNILSSPTVYHYARHMATGGLPFRQWARLYGLTDPRERVADLGCGPADILRYVSREHRPDFYLGIDISDEYLDAARSRAAAAQCPAEFLNIDLTRIPRDEALRSRIVSLLEEHGITRVLLLGVMHHIGDEAIITTLDMVHRAATVRTMVTQDVVRIPGRRINNRYCDMDRGQFIRDEAGYDAVMARSAWPQRRKFWTSPRLPLLRYLHYELSK
jgi:SAM-dependent methyltransferase